MAPHTHPLLTAASSQSHSKTLYIAGGNCSPSNPVFSSKSILNGKFSNFVNSHLIDVDEVGIDEVGIDEVHGNKHSILAIYLPFLAHLCTQLPIAKGKYISISN